jgi:hypothetical protein
MLWRRGRKTKSPKKMSPIIGGRGMILSIYVDIDAAAGT